MRYIITEDQYDNFRKSVIRIFLRRLGHRIDEIVKVVTQEQLDWYSRKPGDLHQMGPEGFIDIIIDDVWQYTYECYVEADVEYGDEEQDIMRDYLYRRYSDKIKEMYNSYVGRDLNESEDKSNRKMELFQKMIDDILGYFKESCDKPYDEFPNDITVDICDDAELIKRIEVVDFKLHNGKEFNINVRVKYSSIRSYVDMHEFLWYISSMMKKRIGMKITIHELENINTNTNREW